MSHFTPKRSPHLEERMRSLYNILSLKARQIFSFVFRKADPAFLIFILLLTNYRISFKIIALVGMYIYKHDLRFQRNGVFYFYLSMIGIGLLNLAISGDYSVNHIMVVLTGCLFWLACLLSFHQLKLFVESTSENRIIATLQVFTIVNFAASLIDIGKVMLVTHTINPYVQLSVPPYGISSGDLVGGVMGELYLVNTVVCSLLTLFFIYKERFLFSLMAFIPFLLTGSNLGTFFMIAALGYRILTGRLKIYKYYALFLIAITLVFYVKVTPSNFEYMQEVTVKVWKQFYRAKPDTRGVNNKQVDSVHPQYHSRPKTDEELLQAYIASLGSQSNDAKYQKLAEATQQQQLSIQNQELTIYLYNDSLQKAKLADPLFEYGGLKKFDLTKESGKITSFKQTHAFMASSPKIALIGGGIASFSSRILYITSGMVIDSRILNALPHYETEAFIDNHKAISKYLLFLDESSRSITNLPFCWYNQVLSEYGLLGMLAFLILYLGFFVRRLRKTQYSFLFIGLIIAFLFFDYWFERISVMVFFELLMLVDLKAKNAVLEGEAQL